MEVGVVARSSRFPGEVERIAVTNGIGGRSLRRSTSRSPVVGAVFAGDVDAPLDRRRRSLVGRFVVVVDGQNQSNVAARNPLEKGCMSPTPLALSYSTFTNFLPRFVVLLIHAMDAFATSFLECG